MANTYYDSELTAEEIEDVLEAISGILTQANNGKVLAISDGKIEARSVQWGGGGGNYQSKTVTPSANEQTVSPDSGYDALSSVVVNGDVDLVAGNIKKDVEIFGVTGSYEGSGSDPVLYANSNATFDFAQENGLICTIGNRTYNKTNSDPCICAYVYRKGATVGYEYTGPILVAKSEDAVKNSQDSQAIPFTYKGETWYRGGSNNAIQGNQTSSSGFAVKLNDLVAFQTLPTHEEAAIALLDYYYATGKVTFSADGNYPIPNGYDGFNNAVVNVSLNLQSKEVTQNGAVRPDSGYNGLSEVIVNVSGGSTPTLPSEYQEVEYITFDGNEYMLVTGLPSDMVIDVLASNSSSVAESCVVGYREASNNNTDFEIRFQYGSFNIWQRSSTYTLQAMVTYPNENTLNVIREIGCFCKNHTRGKFLIGKYSTENNQIPFYGNLYGIKVLPGRVAGQLQDLNVLRQFVPCYRKADNEVGVYELITSTFYPNEGTGTLVAGPDVN